MGRGQLIELVTKLKEGLVIKLNNKLILVLVTNFGDPYPFFHFVSFHFCFAFCVL